MVHHHLLQQLPALFVLLHSSTTTLPVHISFLHIGLVIFLSQCIIIFVVIIAFIIFISFNQTLRICRGLCLALKLTCPHTHSLHIHSLKPPPPHHDRLLQQLQSISYPLDFHESPVNGIYKINTDAAIFQDGGSGLGFVIQNHEGLVMAAGARHVREQYELVIAEAMAILFGLRIATDLLFDRVSIESIWTKCEGRLWLGGRGWRRSSRTIWKKVDEDDVKVQPPKRLSGGVYAFDPVPPPTTFQMLDKVEGAIVGFGNGVEMLGSGGGGRGKSGRTPVRKNYRQIQLEALVPFSCFLVMEGHYVYED